MIASLMILGSSAIIFVLGAIHLVLTFSGPKLRPRSAEVTASLKSTSPGISTQTTMWRAWLGFNASHSLGAMLFGAIYGYLAVVHAAILFESTFVGLVGLIVLVSYAVLGRLYWFSTPYRGILAALSLYVLGYLIRLFG